MISPNEQYPRLDSEEKEFVERLATHYAPTPMTPAERIAFDEALDTRLRRRQRTRVFVPALAAVAVAGVLFWLAFARSIDPIAPQERARPGVVVADPAAADAQEEETRWAYDLFYPSELADADDIEDDVILPDEYLAIDAVLLDPAATAGPVSSLPYHKADNHQAGGNLPCVYAA